MNAHFLKQNYSHVFLPAILHTFHSCCCCWTPLGEYRYNLCWKGLSWGHRNMLSSSAPCWSGLFVCVFVSQKKFWEHTTDLHFLSSLCDWDLYQVLSQKNKNTQCKGQEAANQDKKLIHKIPLWDECAKSAYGLQRALWDSWFSHQGCKKF